MKHRLLILLLALLPIIGYGQGQQWLGNDKQLNGWYGGVTAKRVLRLPHAAPNVTWWDSCAYIWFDSAGTKAIYYNDCNSRTQILSIKDSDLVKSWIAQVDTTDIAYRTWVMANYYNKTQSDANYQPIGNYIYDGTHTYSDTVRISSTNKPIVIYTNGIVRFVIDTNNRIYSPSYWSIGDNRQNVVIGGGDRKVSTIAFQNTIYGASDPNGTDSIKGANNVFMGAYAGKTAGSDSDNTYIGIYAGIHAAGRDNTYIGDNNGPDTRGRNNTMVGCDLGWHAKVDSSIYFGVFSGLNDTGSGHLIIDNARYSTPYLKADMNALFMRLRGSIRKSANDTTDGIIYNRPPNSSNITDSILSHNPTTNAIELRPAIQYQPIAKAVNITGINYTLSNANNGQQLYCSNTNGTTIIIPTGLQDSFTCAVYQNSSGYVYFSNASGVTIHDYQNFTYVKTAGIYARATISHSPTVNTYVISGELSNNPALLLNTYTGAWGAYSLNKINATYSGYAVHVIRSDNSAASYIGFDTSGHFDTLTRQSFCAGTTCLVDTQFDQSGSGNNVYQPQTSRQPSINDSEIIFNGSTSSFVDSFAAPFTYTGDGQIYVVMRSAYKNASTENAAMTLISQGSVTNSNEMAAQAVRALSAGMPGSLYGAGTNWFYGTNDHNINQYYLVGFKWQNWSTSFTNGNTKIYWNNAENTPYLGASVPNPTALGNVRFFVGKPASSSFAGYHFNGKMKLILVYPNNTNNVSNLNTAINALHHIY